MGKSKYVFFETSLIPIRPNEGLQGGFVLLLPLDQTKF